MTDLLTDLGKIAGVLAFLGYIPYLMSIVRRKTLPNPATWWIWSIMGGILFASYYLEGNREAIWVPLSYFIGPTVTGMLSLKYGRNEFGNFEKYCLGGAAVSLILWQVSGPVVALTMLIMIDLIAIAPTLRKTYFKPNSEDPLAWSIFWIANTINLYVVVASEAPTYASIAYPLELFFLPTSIMLLVIRGKILGLDKPKRQQFQSAYAAPSPSLEQAYNTPDQSIDQMPAATFQPPNVNEPFDAALNQLVRQGARQIISQAVTAELNELLTQQGTQQSATDLSSTPVRKPAAKKTPSTSLGEAEKQQAEKHPAEGNQAKGNQAESQPLNSEDKRSKLIADNYLEPLEPSEHIELTPQLLPPYLHNSTSPEALLPWIYLQRIPEKDFSRQLSTVLEAEVDPLSAKTISQIKETWQQEHQNWQTRSLAHQRYVYIWADSIQFERPNGSCPSVLIIVGMGVDGYSELLSIEAGDPTSEANWKELLLQLQSQGLHYDPQLAISNSQNALWKALNQVFPTTQQQECWSHKTASVLQQLPTKLQPKANKALWEIYRAETATDASEAMQQFVDTYQSKYPEATECLSQHAETLLTFYQYPAEHWQALRSNSLIDSVFSTLRINTVDVQGASLNQEMEQVASQALSSAAFKLVASAKKKWQRIRGVKHLGDIIEGILFIDGIRTAKTLENDLNKENNLDSQAAA